VHGGAGAARPSEVDYRAGLIRAADAGHQVLTSGGDAVDAVVQAVQVMEGDPAFNAGYGSVLNSRGEVELDAGVMRGRDQKFGSVAAVRGVPNPVLLARAVLESPLVMLAGQGAERYAEERGIPRCDPARLITQERFQAWAHWMASGQPQPYEVEGDGYGTVGAVARDRNGALATATSTGGISFTPPGRVGDSPLPGAGMWADARAAASATGDGDRIARTLLCRRAVELLSDSTPDEAAQAALHEMETAVGGQAGLILVDQRGSIGVAYNTEVMGHAWRSDEMDEPLCEGTTPEPVAG